MKRRDGTAGFKLYALITLHIYSLGLQVVIAAKRFGVSCTPF
jgi:hypothetical protein